MRNRYQAGDTIVEVLLAIVVVSSVLAGAYASANRSLRGGRQAQERAEALKMVESQIEQLKAASASNNAVFSTQYYCFDSSGALKTLNALPNSDPDVDDFSVVYPGACRYGTIPGNYNLSIVPDAASRVFTVRARWDNVQGTGRDEVKIFYRINP